MTSKEWAVKYVDYGRWAGRVVLEEVFADGKAQVIASIDMGWLRTHNKALLSEDQTKLLWKTWKKYGV